MSNNMERFNKLLRFVHNHEDDVYILYDKNGKSIMTEYDTDYESDNGLEEDEEGYKEYHSILFRSIQSGALIEVNYLQLPIKIECNGQNVYEIPICC